MSKSVNFQCVYEVSDSEYTHVAINQNGVLVGFHHAPVRDTRIGEWIDCTDGSGGELIPYDKWETSARTTAELTDMKKTFYGGANKRQEAIRNAEEYKRARSGKKGKK